MNGIWLGQVICLHCYLVQPVTIATVEVTWFVLEEYVVCCPRCGCPYSQAFTH